jgi:Cu(I)/Ag(I) efflux system membrane fusion protein
MKRSLYIVLLLLLMIGSFLVGSWYSQRKTGNDASAGRLILYYVDPMNPAHTSDKPGLAPCGMKMEPVYADNGPSGQVPSSMAPGTLRISPEKQQLIGVRVGQVEKTSINHLIRTTGRVAADETKIYFINATVDGWINKTLPNSTGSFVKKNEVLATFYSPEFLSAGQALLFALSSMDRVQATGKESPAQQDQMTQFRINLQQYKDSLRNLGMGELQIEEMIRTRKFMENIDITSPSDGFVIARNVSDGQRFEKGKELYRIADMSRVWILADLFRKEAQHVRPAAKVRVTVPYEEKAFQASVSKVLPQFDAATRTLKVRLEVENPDFALRPDMFVDVEFPITLLPTLTVPVDAVLDSGLRKTVFVDLGNGFFEPRQVETGWRLGERVEIIKGLMPGERIVIAGTFLLDSESRMKMAAAGVYGTLSKDPVCGMDVDESKAKAAGRTSERGGKTFYFCADVCKQQFDKDPGRYLEKPAGSGKPNMAQVAQAEQRAKDPICDMFVSPGAAAKAGRVSEYRGKSYYFCADECKQQFDRDPKRYVEKTNGTGKAGGTHGVKPEQQAKDPVCGKDVVISVAAKPTTMSEYRGKTYYFCCPHCKASFDRNPQSYTN